MKPRILRPSTLLLVVSMALVSRAVAQPGLTPHLPSPPDLSSTYVLDGDSAFAQGCVLLCLCPIFEIPNFRGTFDLKRVSTSVVAQSYEISDVNWLAGKGTNEIRTTGSGTYEVLMVGPANQQRLILDLKVGDQPVTTYDSGWVIGGVGGEHPVIDLSIGDPTVTCFGTFMNVSAAAIPEAKIVRYGIVQGQLTEGCLPPCLCPVFLVGEVTGSFGLVPIPSGRRWVEFAVVDVEWQVPAGPTLPAFVPVTGAGFYRVAGNFNGKHRMFLDLDVGGNAESYDSGIQDGENLPFISISVAMNGFLCYDKVFAIEAAPKD